MSSIAPSPNDRVTVLSDDGRFVGVATRTVSWVIDALVINLVAIMTGLGADLIFSIFPVSPDFAAILKPIAGGIYIAWCALYFVTLWSWTGQTVGARVMQIRLLTTRGGRVKPARALVRWIGMNLAMLPLFLGFAPILFRRRGFPDWLAHTKVIEWEQLSIAQSLRSTTARARSEPLALPSSISTRSDA
jgi:hypothetical protein